jgi:hypothetical protein
VYTNIGWSGVQDNPSKSLRNPDVLAFAALPGGRSESQYFYDKWLYFAD